MNSELTGDSTNFETTDEDFEEFLVLLEETERFVELLPEGIDFGIDPYDPVVENLMEIVAQEEFGGKAPDEKKMLRIYKTGIRKYITYEKRFEISEIFEQAAGIFADDEREIFDALLIALESRSLHPLLIGLLFRLFREQILEIVWERFASDLDDDPEIDASELDLLLDEGSRKAGERSRADQYAIIATVKSRIYHEEYPVIDAARLLDLIVDFPCHKSAKLLVEIFLDRTQTIEEMEMLTSRMKKMLPLVKEQIFHAVECGEYSHSDKIQAYSFLIEAEEGEVFDFLRRELLDRGSLPATPAEPVKEHEEVEFYENLARMLIALGDRRAVPVLIKILHTGADFDLTRTIMGRIKETALNSEWREEILEGLHLLDEDELVFVDADTPPIERLPGLMKEHADFLHLLGEEPTLDKINKKLNVDTDRWNRAYHAELDGLRPMDLAAGMGTPLGRSIHARMFQDFLKENKGDNEESGQEIMARFNEYQSKWMLTSLDDHGGDLPLVLKIKEERKLADTYYRKRHFEIYYGGVINDLFEQARGEHENGNEAEALLLYGAVLAIEPDHPFARKFEGLLKSAGTMPAPRPDGSVVSELNSKITAAGETAGIPFFYDNIMKFRSGLKKHVEKEVRLLRRGGTPEPVMDQGDMILQDAFLEHEFKRRFSDTDDISDKDGALFLNTLTLDYEATVNFELFGKRAFYIEPALSSRIAAEKRDNDVPFPVLLHTSFALIYSDSSMVKLFNECFYGGGLVAEYDTPLSVFVTEAPIDGKRCVKITAVRLSKDFEYHGLADRRLYIGEGRTINNALRTTWELEQDEQHEDFQKESSFFFDETRLLFYDIIVRTISYLVSKDARIREVLSPSKKLARRVRKAKSAAKKIKLQKRLAELREETTGLDSYYIVS